MEQSKKRGSGSDQFRKAVTNLTREREELLRFGVLCACEQAIDLAE
jgi:hypothetical protein